MISLRDGMGWGLAGMGNSSAAAAIVVAVAAPSKMCAFGETVSFAIGSKMRDLGAILPPF